MSQMTEQLAQLFDASGRAHHQAFIETEGDDPEWPAWYAAYLVDKMPAILGLRLEANEIAEDLELLAAQAPQEARDEPWQTYYAAYFVEKYA